MLHVFSKTEILNAQNVSVRKRDRVKISLHPSFRKVNIAAAEQDKCTAQTLDKPRIPEIWYMTHKNLLPRNFNSAHSVPF